MTKYFSEISTCADRLGIRYPMVIAHVLWLRQHDPLVETALQLKEEMIDQGLSLEMKEGLDYTSLRLAHVDLILLEAIDCVDGIVETIVARIRLKSRVPLVVLTDGYSTEQLVTALAAGADAIWTFNTPVKVLIARCRAMLRRRSLPTLNSIE
jgi:DNA-binding response OmpR family regulator